jgi:hypothetical protein
MLAFFLCLASVCTFVPPEGWECVKNPAPSSYVQIGFLGEGDASTPFRPSLNLAIEETHLSLKEYLKVVRELHETEMNVRWRDLGQLTFHAGQGRLTELTSHSPCGEVKMLQGIFVSGGHAYILTGATLKEEFSQHQSKLLSSIRSLVLSPNLFSRIEDKAKRLEFEERFKTFETLSTLEMKKAAWEKLQKRILEDFSSLGSYWHFLILQEGYKRIFKEKV